jgi:site-specific recombinase XerD
VEVRYRPSRKLPPVPTLATIESAITDEGTMTGKNDEERVLLALRNKAMIELSYGSGLRRSEIARLAIEDLDFTAATARILGKGGKSRIVPLTAAACEAIRAYLSHRRASTGPLFVSVTKGTRLQSDSLWLIFKRTGGIRPHLYRHACATHLLKNGCDLRIIQELLGHTLLTSTQLYTHIEKHDLRRVINSAHPRGLGQATAVCPTGGNIR